jgi:glutamate-1-semialdehyde 2,1-aminomutase
MGGGFPAAAFGGRADVMSRLSPEGPVYQAGTLSGNPIATTAGLATLRLATDDVYKHIDEASRSLQASVADAFEAGGLPYLIQSTGNMFSVFFVEEGVSEVPDFEVASTQRTDRFKVFFHAMLDQGVYLPPSAFEAWFLSSAHDDTALDRVVTALPAAVRAAAGVPDPEGAR